MSNQSWFLCYYWTAKTCFLFPTIVVRAAHLYVAASKYFDTKAQCSFRCSFQCIQDQIKPNAAANVICLWQCAIYNVQCNGYALCSDDSAMCSDDSGVDFCVQFAVMTVCCVVCNVQRWQCILQWWQCSVQCAVMTAWSRMSRNIRSPSVSNLDSKPPPEKVETDIFHI